MVAGHARHGASKLARAAGAARLPTRGAAKKGDESLVLMKNRGAAAYLREETLFLMRAIGVSRILRKPLRDEAFAVTVIVQRIRTLRPDCLRQHSAQCEDDPDRGIVGKVPVTGYFRLAQT
eukprot:6166969-Pleurochrysis_carterae.AAC.4